MNKKYFGVKEISITAALLAICIISQLFKNLSIFITGPIVNACIIIAVLAANLPCAILLCIITPVTAYIIAASPVMSTVPLIIPFIMLGNIVLAVATTLLLKKSLSGENGLKSPISYIKAVICAVLKGAFMGLTISLWLLPTFIPAESKLYGKLPVFQTTFSLYQAITAAIGFVYAFIIWAALRKIMKKEM